MVCKQAHWHSGVGETLGDHERRQSHAERIIVITGVPD